MDTYITGDTARLLANMGAAAWPASEPVYGGRLPRHGLAHRGGMACTCPPAPPCDMLAQINTAAITPPFRVTITRGLDHDPHPNPWLAFAIGVAIGVAVTLIGTLIAARLSPDLAHALANVILGGAA